jgi:antitoxin MazE
MDIHRRLGYTFASRVDPERTMRVAKWGNSLAIRIPADVAEKLGVKAGDEVEGRMNDRGRLEIARKISREEALRQLWEIADADPLHIPPGYHFARADAYDE